MSWRQKLFSTSKNIFRLNIYSATAVSVSLCAIYGYTQSRHLFQSSQSTFIKHVLCAEKSNLIQNSVISGTKAHALYLTIHLKADADPIACAKSLAKLDGYIDNISPPDLRDESDEILAGVGFGPNMLSRIYPCWKKDGVENFTYTTRKGNLGNMPATDGDIFIHAKCDQQGNLFQLAKSIIDGLPANSVDSVEDVYGWVYRGGRDLSGFIDGTENPADDESRTQVAVNKQTHGSYVITQKWIHNHSVINSEKEKTMESWIGRTRADSTVLRGKSPTSHVHRMDPRLDNEKHKPKQHEIVRQSQPWGTVAGASGLFFIAYAQSPTSFDWMLDRMTGAGGDSCHDDVMRLTSCVSGTYWYFPSRNQLRAIYGLKTAKGLFG